MKLFRIVLLIAITLPLQGCFIIIPGKVIGGVQDLFTGEEGEHCVGENVKVGEYIRGGYHVSSLSGRSSRCTNPAYPIRAMLVSPHGDDSSSNDDLPQVPDYADAPEVDERNRCVKADARVGDTYFTPYEKAVVVKTLHGKSTDCRNPDLPIKAELVSPEEYSRLLE